MSTLPNVIDLTSEFIQVPSVSRDGNVEVSNVIAAYLVAQGFELERLEYYKDDVLKVSLVAKKGEGEGGLGFFSHSDTVPGAEDAWGAFEPKVKDGKLYGRGSCDMKGPLAATMIAAANADANKLKKPIYVVATADEEYGFGGAIQVNSESQMFAQNWPDMGVVAEPSELIPIYAHKGGHFVTVTAKGRAAHSSLDTGVSANFLIAPFLADVAKLKEKFMTDPYFMDDEFIPATNGLNLTIDDGNCAQNVTAAQTIATINLRAMPKAHTKEAVNLIIEKAKAYGFDIETRGMDAFYSDPDSDIIQLSCETTGINKAITVPYGTEALVFQEHLPLVILGPGNIEQAHTVGEWIDVGQLERSVNIYQTMIEKYCY